MADYESNSHKSREKKNVGKVVTGEVVTRKKNGLQKFADNLISDGIENVRDYVIREIIAPKAKDMFSETVHRITEGIAEGVDKLLYGESDHYRSSGQARPYGSYYGNRGTAQTVTYRSSTFHSEDFIFRSRGDAEMVLRELKENLSYYNVVSVADFKSLVQGDTYATYTDNNYGWTSLRDAKIRQVHGGYILELPKSVYLGD